MRYDACQQFAAAFLLVEKLLETDLGILFHKDFVLSTDNMLLELLIELVDDGLCFYARST